MRLSLTRRRQASMLMDSAWVRLAGALVLVGGLWLAVAWALAS
ncbi:MAG: hypothetical protein Q8K96_14205 [Rubrivivax sp.]|nr:hypothetical protein [Rubrivivax sp.]